MKKIVDSMESIVCFFGMWIPVISCILVLNGEIAPIPVVAVIACLVTAFIYRERHHIDITELSNNMIFKVVVICVCVVAIAARAYPMFVELEFIAPTLEDTGVHYNAAQQLLTGGLTQEIMDYEMVYPFLFPYTLTLGFANWLVGNKIQTAIVLSNILFDMLGCFFCYRALKHLKPVAAKIGAVLWIINPMSVVMCWMSLNIVLVNMWLALVFYVAIIVFINFRNKRTYRYVLAFCFGVVVFVANVFRPIFMVFLIAFVLALIFESKETVKEKSIVITLALIGTMIPTLVRNAVVTDYFGENIFSGCGGWNFYVGSNYETMGQWSPGDRDYFFGEIYLNRTTSVKESHSIIMKDGIDRYLKMNMLQFVNHMFNKASVLFSKSNHVAHDLQYAFGISWDSPLYRKISSLVGCYFTILTLISSVWLFNNSKNKRNLFFVLGFLGIYAALLLVEVMDRYSSVFFAMFVFFAALQLDDSLCDKRQASMTHQHYLL